jgi:tryptophan-rich sensory protein
MHTLTTKTTQPNGRQPSLLANIIGSLALVMLVNAPIFLLEWDGRAVTPYTSPLSPPSWVVGVVWTGLFAGFGYARYRLLRVGSYLPDESGRQHAVRARKWLDGYIVFCAFYPFYTLLPASELAGFVGNLATIGLAAAAVSRIWAVDRRAAVAVLASIAWVSFATLLTGQALGFFPGGVPSK